MRTCRRVGGKFEKARTCIGLPFYSYSGLDMKRLRDQDERDERRSDKTTAWNMFSHSWSRTKQKLKSMVQISCLRLILASKSHERSGNHSWAMQIQCFWLIPRSKLFSISNIFDFHKNWASRLLLFRPNEKTPAQNSESSYTGEYSATDSFVSQR